MDEKAIYAKGVDDGIKVAEEKLKKEKLETVRKLKNKGLNVKEIAEITGLKIEEI